MLYPEPFMAVIARRKAGLLQHVGVLLPDRRVAHCAPAKGEHLSSIEDFANGEDVTIVRVLAASEHVATLERITEAMRAPKGYHVTANNCEAFANRMTGQKVESPQLQGVVALLSLVALIGLASARS